jgi:glyoxylase-like metal-dependent hydrolase (beta-lactamase superfamily II)
MQEIEQGIYIETSYPGVTLGAVVLPQGTLLIDAPLRQEDARSWRAALVNLGSGTARMLVNLDTHPDRTLGARVLEATIIAHQKTSQVFKNRPSVFKGQNVESGSEWETYNEAVGTRWAIPDITFNSQMKLHWGPPDVICEYHPGPSVGAIWVIIPESKVIFVGDAVLHNQPPFLTNGDIPAWLESLDELRKGYQDYTLVTGRGGTAPVEAVRAQQQVLKNILKGLEKLAKRKASAEATHSLIPGILSGISASPHLEDQYTQRIRHGLIQYYARCYRPEDAAVLLRENSEEQS